MEQAAPHSEALRRRRFSRPLELYHVTKCPVSGCVLADNQRDDLCGAFLHFRAQAVIFLQAFVIMPDHWHALLVLGNKYSLGTAVQQINRWASYSSRQAGRRIAWQEEFHDHRVRGGENVVGLVRYIEGNPVRKGLANHAHEWRWSSAHPDHASRLDRALLGIRAWDEA